MSCACRAYSPLSMWSAVLKAVSLVHVPGLQQGSWVSPLWPQLRVDPLARDLSCGDDFSAAEAVAAPSHQPELKPARTLSVLIIHEHHFKAIGSDQRLMGVLLQLRALGCITSCLFRATVPPAQRAPPTRELTRMIYAKEAIEASILSATDDPPPPPALYEYTDLASLSVLARRGYFDVVLCSLWFWRDPMPSTAELFLPVFAMHAPPTRRPYIGVLSDDAHSAKASMMAQWEADKGRKAQWKRKETQLPLRQRAVYSLADAIVHISSADAGLERSMFNATCRRWFVLKMSPRGIGLGPGVPQVERTQNRTGLMTIGFTGNGITPTNYLSIQWFLQHVWPDLRIRFPQLRLRLIGFLPDDRPKKQQQACDAAISAARCGWAWGTPFAGHEEDSAIDQLGFLSDQQMESEMLSWQAMVVPILHTTGVNTKLLPALRWGIPIVLTSVAASPLGIPLDGSVALIADDGLRFVAQLSKLLQAPDEVVRFGSLARDFWDQMLADDAASSDLQEVLRPACSVLRLPESQRPLAVTLAASTPSPLVAFANAKRRAPASSCFGKQQAPALVVALHGASAPEPAALLVHVVWHEVCRYCRLRCSHSFSAPGSWDVLLEHELTSHPDEMAASLSRAFVLLAPRKLHLLSGLPGQSRAALQHFGRVGSLESRVPGERMRSRLPAALLREEIPPRQHHVYALDPVSPALASRHESEWVRVFSGLGLQSASAPALIKSIGKLIARASKARVEFKGCFKGGGPGASSWLRGSSFTTQACAGACTASPLFGLWGGGRCFCAEMRLLANMTRASEASCGQVCRHEEEKVPPRLCGGRGHAAMYAIAWSK